MDSSTRLGTDNRLDGSCFFCGGHSLFAFRVLPGVLGTHKAGTQCGILVLSNPYRDYGFGVIGSDDTCSIFVPNWGGWYCFAAGYPARPSSRDHFALSTLWSQAHNKSNTD